MGPYARIAVPFPIHRTFQYAIPDALVSWARRGVRCLVPFGRSRAVGFLVGLDPEPEIADLRSLLEILDQEPCLPEELLDLGAWLSAYYHHPLGEVLSTLLPTAYRASTEPLFRAAIGRAGEAPKNRAQSELLRRIRESGPVSLSRVRPSELQAIEALLRRGHLERSWVAVSAPSLRSDFWFRAAPGAPRAAAVWKRSPQQARVIEVLSAGSLPSWMMRARGISTDALGRAVRRGWVERFERPPSASDPSGFAFRPESGERPRLTPEQSAAVGAVSRALDSHRFSPFLLHGVTGSGKTEVYIRAVEETLRRGRSAVVLVPEIALTPQMLGRFLAVFEDRVAILHSGLGERERRLQWERVRRGEAPIALGARSAVFAPARTVGLLVVDEEHDPSYKQEEGLRYHAKHVALMRARACGAAVILGSATPDVETLWSARSRRYERLTLPERVGGANLPEVRIVDLRQEELRRRARVLLSEPLRREVDQALSRGEQVLFFLNRRGFSPAVFCPACGESLRCRRCSISLTLHRQGGGGTLLCHYCGIRIRVPPACPGCGAAELLPSGAGTQKLMAATLDTWPGARVLRLDRDVARKGGGAEVLGAFHRGEADILIGTQMIVKGHHFPRLTVVGVVDSDLSLHVPDFRAAERTFQILTQVAGRAGRSELAGVVFFQTRNPDHPAVQAAAKGDYASFAAAEIRARREAGFPPFRRLALLRISSRDEEEARGAAQFVAEEARRAGAAAGIEILGPAPAPVERIRSWWRFQVLLRSPGSNSRPLQAVLDQLFAHPGVRLPKTVRLTPDMDPQSLT